MSEEFSIFIKTKVAWRKHQRKDCSLCSMLLELGKHQLNSVKHSLKQTKIKNKVILNINLTEGHDIYYEVCMGWKNDLILYGRNILWLAPWVCNSLGESSGNLFSSFALPCASLTSHLYRCALGLVWHQKVPILFSNIYGIWLRIHPSLK